MNPEQIEEQVETRGDVEIIIEYKDGRKEIADRKNTILRKGREALAASLANEVGDTYNFYVSRMLFGDGGNTAGVPKAVNTNRNGLFGLTRANKPVISSINPDIPYQVIFTSVLSFDDANGYAINELALQMNSGDLYSMVTRGDISKTEEMQITVNWRITFI